LATLSDGEDTLIAAMKKVWPNAPHQRCQEHFLGNLAEEVLDDDTQLRQGMRQSLGGLPKVKKKRAPHLSSRG
jgi:transposase-like protein